MSDLPLGISMEKPCSYILVQSHHVFLFALALTELSQALCWCELLILLSISGRKNSGGEQRQWDWRGPALSSDAQLHDLSSNAEEGSQTVC